MTLHPRRKLRIRARIGSAAHAPGGAAARICAVLVAVTLMAPVSATPNVAALVGARQDRFEEMGEAIKVLRDQLRSDTPDASAVPAAAAVIAGYAGRISDWFPEGSGTESGVKTDALPYIWRNWDKFSGLDDELARVAATLTKAAASGDTGELMAAFRAVGGTCKSCHDSFRAD